MKDDAPPGRGDVVSWRETEYVVKAVFKWTVRLEGQHHGVKIRCLRPIAEGGFSEAKVLRRAGRIGKCICAHARA